MINFRTSLEKWGLERNYVVLCLDADCMQAAKAQKILAYGGYFAKAKETGGEWRTLVGGMKVDPQ